MCCTVDARECDVSLSAAISTLWGADCGASDPCLDTYAHLCPQLLESFATSRMSTPRGQKLSSWWLAFGRLIESVALSFCRLWPHIFDLVCVIMLSLAVVFPDWVAISPLRAAGVCAVSASSCRPPMRAFRVPPRCMQGAFGAQAWTNCFLGACAKQNYYIQAIVVNCCVAPKTLQSFLRFPAPFAK